MVNFQLTLIDNTYSNTNYQDIPVKISIFQMIIAALLMIY